MDDNAKLKARIEELEKNNGVTTKLESENAELKARVAKLEENYRLMQNDNATIVTGPSNNSSPNFNSDTLLPKELIPEVSPVSSKSSKIVAFLDRMHKEKVSDEIRQRNREKKLQAQESLLIPPEEERPQVLDFDIQPCSSSTSEVSENVNLGCPNSEPVIIIKIKLSEVADHIRKKEWMNLNMNYSTPLWNQRFYYQ